MKRYFRILLLSAVISACNAQSSSTNERIVGGPCEDCEALLDYQMLSIQPAASTTLPGFIENEPKIKITGTVFHSDGKTPASKVLLYVYHVDRDGIYQASDQPVGWEKRHGQHRAWLETDENGQYTFYTFRPAAYPEVGEPEHIHIYVKEPTTAPYYIDSFLFEDDPLLTREIIDREKRRGGSGIVKLTEEEGVLTANRDIILGLNIPNYE